MVTAVDTNILLDVIVGGIHEQKSLAALRSAATEGLVLISSVCYSEIASNKNDLDLGQVLNDLSLGYSPLDRQAAFLAGHLHCEYRARGGTRERILPDFLIAAHAQVQADRLLTRDHRFHSLNFPDLLVIRP